MIRTQQWVFIGTDLEHRGYDRVHTVEGTIGSGQSKKEVTQLILSGQMI